ncbi:TIR domain-containing protein [Clostridium beijerinckii]|uniref:TIR domain-containing protein n=2 Tax=Clostridium beijerinckii TaxID=1520 RepID=A0AAW3WFT7_CLOBE|nr:TIR domain-containing protein [Clostridium beijerinckii]MBC2460135.1 TIR domain-containing protein [Clostridium beijerinckii]MBC2477616.1 TIR domain-containing protein [Clostridium beijerinckii]NOV59857.1 hypothetical protein [Clostridium beijerinckii]NOV71359.1 hypothetical protein [Clostridium beijerinckii]NOW34285.1 hypothetical protein [Clostridium beijerinckii]
MAHKTFISYKYSEAKNLRDDIIEAMGDDAVYYKGETSDSPDLTDTSTENIKKNLKDMMFGTTVTIVILTPNMKKSKWIDWEIEYTLKRITRNGKRSQTNGIVGVIKKDNGGYSWFKTESENCHGTSTISYNSNKVFSIIFKNHFNSKPSIWHCDECKTYDYMNGSYITYVEEETFLKNIDEYINNAFDKSEKESNYDITRTK